MSNKTTATTSPPIKFYFVLILLMASPLLASDIYLPAFPHILKAFVVSEAKIKYTLAYYLVGIGIAQIAFGFLLDKINKTNTLIILCFAFFSLISFSIATLKSFELIYILRALQGICVSLGSVLGRSIISKHFDSKQSAQVFAVVFPLVATSPAYAPIIGGLLTYYLNWRWCFVFLGLVGLLIVYCIFSRYLRLPKKSGTNNDFNEGNDLNNKSRVIFFACLLLVVCSYSAWYIFIAEIPFFYHRHDYSILRMSIMFAPLTAGFFVGNMFARTIIKKSVRRALSIGVLIFFVITMGQLFLYLDQPSVLHPAMLVSIMSMITFANGFIMPSATAIALSSVAKERRGLASGVLSSAQVLVPAVIIFVIAQIPLATTGKLTLVFSFLSVIGLLAHLSSTFLKSRKLF